MSSGCQSSQASASPSPSSSANSFPGQEVGEHVKAAVLIASLTAAVVAAVLLRRRNATYRRLWEAENIDADADGIPDIYQREADAPTFERN